MVMLKKGVVAAALVLSLISFKAFAAGTIAGTDITNEAFVDFSVGGVAQAQVSDDVTFKVDRVVNFTVVSDGNLNVVPSATGRVLPFTVTNTGNYVGDFSLSAINDAGDDFNPASMSVFVESGANAGYQPGEDTATFIDELAADGSIVVYIVSTMPGGIANGDESIVHLEATARAGGSATVQGAVLTQTAGADDPDAVDTVFNDAAGSAAGDGARDGKHSDSGTYTVVTATLVVTKSSAIISDPVNGGTNPKRIPGAVIEYTISIENTGAAQADDLVITDALDANTEYVADSTIVDGVGADDIDVYSTPMGVETITAEIAALAAAATKTVVFRVTIK